MPSNIRPILHKSENADARKGSEPIQLSEGGPAWVPGCHGTHEFMELNIMWHPRFFQNPIYRKVANSNLSRLEAHADFFRLLMKGIFDPYVL